MTLVFTLCSNNYLAQAVTLGSSLLKHNPDYIFKIGLVDRKNSQIDYSAIPFEIVEVEDINIDDFHEMILHYDIQELNTAVKPFYFGYFLNLPDSFNNLIYLDPDILVYGPFSDLNNDLQNNDIIVTPHITMPILDEKLPAENDFLNTGLYNLGFIAIRDSLNSRKMINWWSTRLRDKGYNDVKNGMFTDQIWINFVPLFFERVKLFTHPGYNMAYWNLNERTIYRHGNEFIVNNNRPLIFFHFSGFSPAKPGIISKYQNRFTLSQRSDILPLFQEYTSMLELNNYGYFQSFECHYSGIKEQYVEKIVLERVRQIPIQKRIFKKVVNYLTNKFNIILDYSSFYEREDSGSFGRNA